MGDRTSGTLTIHTAGPEHVRAILDVIDEYHLTEAADFRRGDGKELPAIQLHAAYQVGEFYCGSADEIADMLRENAPGASWTVHEDPAYSWLGSVTIYTPELGRWDAECDAGGTAQFTAAAILERVGDRAALDQLLGTAWTNAVAALTPEDDRTEVWVTAPPLQDATWNLNLREVDIFAPDASDTADPVLTIDVSTVTGHENVNTLLREHGYAIVGNWSPASRAGYRESEVVSLAPLAAPEARPSTGAQLDAIAKADA
jgi:hypothetical protein